jgi:FkbM family methyltransferase
MLNVIDNNIENRHFKSQWGTDKIIDEICYTDLDTDLPYDQIISGDKKGIFLEVGACDGVILSNTFYLEKIRGWQGILVEPIERYYKDSTYNRWTKNIFNGVVYKYDGNVDFQHITGYSELLSGIKEAYHPKILQRVNNEIQHFTQKVDIKTYECLTLNSIINKYGYTNIDYLSLDTQSCELDILKSYDPSKNSIKIISLDTNGLNTDELFKWFDDNNYIKYWKSDVADEYVFINPKLKFTREN